MPDFKIHSVDDAPGHAKDVLERAKGRYGFVPNLIGGMSEAPEVAEAYMTVGDLLRKTSFTPTELHVAWFAANTYHGCDYCMAAHTGIAKADNVADDVIETARTNGTYAAPRLQALKVFTTQMIEDRGWTAPEKIDAFLAAGFTKQNVFEVIMVIAHKTLSNYTNHALGTPVDAVFQKFAWEPAVAAE